MSVVSLSDAKTHLNIDASDTSQDVEIQTFVDAAEDIAAELTTDLSVASHTDIFYGLTAWTVVLRHYPVVTITSATLAYYTGSTPVALTPATDLLVDSSTGVVRRATGALMRGDLTITYTAGFATVPPAVYKGILEIVRDLYQETQQGGRPDRNGDFVQQQTPRWRMLLEPHNRAPRIA